MITQTVLVLQCGHTIGTAVHDNTYCLGSSGHGILFLPHSLSYTESMTVKYSMAGAKWISHYSFSDWLLSLKKSETYGSSMFATIRFATPDNHFTVSFLLLHKVSTSARQRGRHAIRHHSRLHIAVAYILRHALKTNQHARRSLAAGCQRQQMEQTNDSKRRN